MAKKKKKMKMTAKSPAKKKTNKKTKTKMKMSSKGRGKSVESDQDIVALILADHKPLKQLIKTMKSERAEDSEKIQAFKEFAKLLTVHAKSEEESLYVYMKKVKDLREHGFEGQVEHNLADQVVEEAKRASEKELKLAQIKVLAELVEHHIEEEEEEMLPEFKKETNLEDREDIGRHYLALKEELISEGSDDAPREKDIPRQPHHNA
ncbi:MAG: hypothetical protein K0R29_501 [Pseudobdellovibrio sp.]|jgi:hemerythrin superfamily protein|nr:hypothetical protein [Pseudobdellovibrio sp.]